MFIWLFHGIVSKTCIVEQGSGFRVIINDMREVIDLWSAVCPWLQVTSNNFIIPMRHYYIEGKGDEYWEIMACLNLH